MPLPESDPSQMWRGTIREKLIKQEKENPGLLDEIKSQLEFTVEELITVLGEPEAFRKAFLQPQYDVQGNRSILKSFFFATNSHCRCS